MLNFARWMQVAKSGGRVTMLGKPRPFRSAWQLYLRTRGDFASAGRRDARRLGARSPVRYKCFWPVGACNEAARLHSKFFRHEQEVPDEGRRDVRRVGTLTGAWPERHSHRTHLRERERKTRCARRPDAELRTSRGRPAVALGSSHDVVSSRRSVAKDLATQTPASPLPSTSRQALTSGHLTSPSGTQA